MDSDVPRAGLYARIDELGRRYNAAEESGDREECRKVYDELISLGARMMSDGRFHPQI